MNWAQKANSIVTQIVSWVQTGAIIWFTFTFLVTIGIQLFAGKDYHHHLKLFEPWMVQTALALIVFMIAFGLRCVQDYLSPESNLFVVGTVTFLLYWYRLIWVPASLFISA